MRKILKGICSLVKTILWIFVIVLFAVILVQRISNNKKSLAGIRIFTVISPSMVPQYHLGDSILVKHTSPENLKVGDDITYLGEKESFKDRIVTHRIISIEKDENGKWVIQTKGIANEKPDPVIGESQVYGKVLYKIKTITKLNSIMGNLYGMYFIIVVPMACIILWDFLAGRREKKASKNSQTTKDENEDTDTEVSKSKTNKRRNHRRERRNKIRKRQDEES